METRIPATEALRQVTNEHANLRDLLQRICTALANKQANDEVLSLLRDFSDRLERHFQDEEEGGYFREVVVRAPQLSRLAESLESDHPRLLHRLHKIRGQLEACRRFGLELKETSAQFKDFVSAFTSHEEDEQRLIQESFNLELGCSD